MNKITFLILFICFVHILQAQTKNSFLDRDFWKTNPTIEVVEEKIAGGNDVAALNRYGFDAVVYALLEKADNATIEHLLTKKGNEVNKLTHDKRTYVFWAAYVGNVEIMKYLIARKARMDLRDSHRYSVLTFAAATGQTDPEIYELCINNGIDPKNDKDEHGANALLLLTPYLKDFSMLNYFTHKGLDLHSVDDYGNGLFHYTARTGNKAMLDKLIKKGIAYKTLNKNGGNAILFASRGTKRASNSLYFFKYLEALGIAPNITDKKGTTPLHHLAYRCRDTQVLNFFLDKGVDVNQADDQGNTPLIIAANRNSLNVVKLLSKNVKDINAVNTKGRSALTNAIENNSPEVVDLLVGKAADATIVDVRGNHLGYYLIQSYNPEEEAAFKAKTELLTRAGVDIKKPQKNGDTLYHLALEKNDLELLKLVKKFDIDINAKNKDGLTALHKAAMIAKNEILLKYLLSIGADKAIKTDFDESVYDLANENEALKQANIAIDFLK